MENNSTTERQPVNWERIRADYFSGIGLTELAKRHGVPLANVKMRAYRGNWAIQRKLGKVQSNKIAKAVLQSQLEAAKQSVVTQANAIVKQWADRSVGIAGQVREELGGRISPTTENKELEVIARTLDVVDKVGRRGLGLDQGESGPASGRIAVGLRIDLIGSPSPAGQPDPPTITLEPCGSGGQD